MENRIEVVNLLDAASKKKEVSRKYIGLSGIGGPCQRSIWLGFRDATSASDKKISGRQQRLFNRGHREEPAAVACLERAGFKISAWDSETYVLAIDRRDMTTHVLERDSNSQVSAALKSRPTLKIVEPDCGNLLYPIALTLADSRGQLPQYAVRSECGHVRGHLDGIVTKAPLPELVGKRGLFECKTHSKSSFTDLQKKGMQEAKPAHYAQCITYAVAYDLDYILYYAVNKDNDDLYTEIISMSGAEKTKAADYYRLAQSLTTQQDAPKKISQYSSNHICKHFCDHTDVCQGQLKINRTCRSCVSAYAGEFGHHNTGWRCGKHEDKEIPEEFISKTCSSWEPLKL